MASVFKRASEKRRKGSPWWIAYQDVSGKRRTVRGCTDKSATERMAAKLEEDIALRKAGLIDVDADEVRQHESQSLADHIDEWFRDIMAKGKTPKHAQQYRDRASKLVAIIQGASVAELEPGRFKEATAKADSILAEALGSARFSDLKPERIQAALAVLRDSGKALQTLGHYRAAIRSFSRWAIDKGRILKNPMRGVTGFNAEEDVRHSRRILTDFELSRLIEAAENGPDVWGMSGKLRSVAYLTASQTGFRAAELRSLRPESFYLEGDDPRIDLHPRSTKNRKAAEQPIPATLVPTLREWLRDKKPGALVFPLHHETAKAIRADLESIGVPYRPTRAPLTFTACEPTTSPPWSDRALASRKSNGWRGTPNL
jgi:integrase